MSATDDLRVAVQNAVDKLSTVQQDLATVTNGLTDALSAVEDEMEAPPVEEVPPQPPVEEPPTKSK